MKKRQQDLGTSWTQYFGSWFQILSAAKYYVSLIKKNNDNKAVKTIKNCRYQFKYYF